MAEESENPVVSAGKSTPEPGPTDAGSAPERTRRGRPASIRRQKRLRFDEVLARLLATEGKGEIFTLFRERTIEALETWDHPHSWDVYRQLSLIYGEFVAPTLAPESAVPEPTQPILGFSGDAIAKILDATRTGRERLDGIQAAAAPIADRPASH